MTNRKFYKRTVTLEILSEEPIPDGMSIDNIIFEAKEGDYSMGEFGETDTILNGKQAADALLKQGSAPGFFGLEEDGSDV